MTDCIDIPASLAAAHKKHDLSRTLPTQLQFICFDRQKKSIQQKMLHEIFKVRGYPLILTDGCEYTLHLK